MKRLVLQMEKQKGLYEEKALVALQKATQDKTEAVGKAATLQVKGPKSPNVFPRLNATCIPGQPRAYLRGVFVPIRRL